MVRSAHDGAVPAVRGEGQHVAPSRPPALAISDRADGRGGLRAPAEQQPATRGPACGQRARPDPRFARRQRRVHVPVPAQHRAATARLALLRHRRILRCRWSCRTLGGHAGRRGDPTSPANAFITLALISGVARHRPVSVGPPPVHRDGPDRPRRRRARRVHPLHRPVSRSSRRSWPTRPRRTPNACSRWRHPWSSWSSRRSLRCSTWRAAPADRTSLGLAAIGFALYAVSATALAVQTAQGDFMLGSITDLGWIAGHSPWPSASVSRGSSPEGRAQGTVAGVRHVRHVRSVRGSRLVNLFAEPSGTYIAAVGAVADRLLAVAGRQIFIILDNEKLRRISSQGGRTHAARNTANQRTSCC